MLGWWMKQLHAPDRNTCTQAQHSTACCADSNTIAHLQVDLFRVVGAAGPLNAPVQLATVFQKGQCASQACRWEGGEAGGRGGG